MTGTPIAKIEGFVVTNFPGSKLEGEFDIISIKSNATKYVANEEVHQQVINRLCESSTWLVGVNIDPALGCHANIVESRTIKDY